VAETDVAVSTLVSVRDKVIAAQDQQPFGQSVAQIAEKQATEAYVAGAIGPLGVRLEPFGELSREQARAAFAEQIAALAEGGPGVGVDLLILETFSDLAEIREAIFAAREVGGSDMVVIAQVTIDDGSTTTTEGTWVYSGGIRILASDTPENLQKLMSSRSQVIAEIAAPLADLRECWAQMAEIEQFDVSPSEGEYFRCALTPRDGVDLRPQVFSLARERGWSEQRRSQSLLQFLT